MSIANEISRIQEARDTLRAKAVALGVGLSTDNLTQIATKYDGIVDRGTPNAEVREGESFTLGAGYYHGGSIKGVSGGGNYTLQSKTVTPTKSEQVVDNDSGYYGLDTVTVAPIPDIYQDVSSVTATVGDVLSPKVYVDSNGKVQTGTMQNRGAVSVTLDTATTSYSVPAGYHNGSGTVSVVPQTKSATPTKEAQTISADDGKVLSSVTVAAIPKQYADATDKTAVAANILSGKTAISWDSNEKAPVSITGTMENNGAVTPSALNAGGSYTIPAGYHNGSGKVTAKTLASQTGVDTGKTAVTAAQMLTGYQGWVSGTKITGTMANNGQISATITGLGSVTGDTQYTIPAGYTTGGTVSLTNDIETALAAI